jgi:hypothetical protein
MLQAGDKTQLGSHNTTEVEAMRRCGRAYLAGVAVTLSSALGDI